MKKYRIVTDRWSGFEVQEKSLFFWWQSKNQNGDITNTNVSIERAKELIEFLKQKRIHKKTNVVYTE